MGFPSGVSRSRTRNVHQLVPYSPSIRRLIRRNTDVIIARMRYRATMSGERHTAVLGNTQSALGNLSTGAKESLYKTIQRTARTEQCVCVF